MKNISEMRVGMLAAYFCLGRENTTIFFLDYVASFKGLCKTRPTGPRVEFIC